MCQPNHRVSSLWYSAMLRAVSCHESGMVECDNRLWAICGWYNVDSSWLHWGMIEQILWLNFGLILCCKVGCLVFFLVFFLFFLIHPEPFYPLLLVCHTCITIGATFHLLWCSISFYPCSTPILLHITRYKLVTTNSSSFSLTTHDEPICVS